ncbi:hypothetical protein ACWGH3_34185 [Streptomyces sp. NPDC054884]
MLGLYATGTDPVAAVMFLVLMGGALGPVFMTTQRCCVAHRAARISHSRRTPVPITPVSQEAPRSGE